MRWIFIVARAIRNWKRLRKEGKEALLASRLAIIEARKAFLQDEITLADAAQAMDKAIKEISDVAELIGEILG